MSRNQRLSLWDAVFYSLMVGVGETYLPAWALTIGMSEVQAGLFAILPLVMGSLIQILSPWFLARVGSVKRWVLITTAVQALSFIPLFYYSLFPTKNFPILFVIVSFYWAAGFAAGPSWQYWMSYLVDGKQGADFFARRSRFAQFGVLAGIIFGGLFLHWKISLGWITTTFTILFFLAFFFRTTSFILLSLKDYQRDWHLQHPAQTLRKTLSSLYKRKSYRQFFVFIFIFYSVIAISSPFVAPYMLEQLKFNYEQYMLAVAGLFIAKIVATPVIAWGVKKWGIKPVFLIGAFGISPLPMLWVFDDSVLFVFLLQFASGFFWALLEVGLQMVFFSELKTSEKIPVLTIYNVFFSTAWIVGTLIGGKWLSVHGESLQSYYNIFVVGSGLRMLVVLLFIYLSRGSKKELLPNG